MKRRSRRKYNEEHTNHEAWAIPYGDLLTLLLAFFVVMYAISSINEGKYRVLSDSLFAAFRGVPRTMEPIQVGEKQVGSGADIQTTLVQQAILEGQPRSLLAPLPVNPELSTYHYPSPRFAKAAEALTRVAAEVERAMQDLIREKLIFVRRAQLWLEVEIRTDILFPSGSARLSPGAVEVIERLAEVLRPFPNPIRVEGHTDNRPINTVAFFSNWELSAARAGSVVHVLSRHGIDPSRLAVIGYGEHRPVATNDTPEGRNANRRVVIVILSTDPERDPDERGDAAVAAARDVVAEPRTPQESEATPGVAPVAVTGTVSAP